MGELRVRVQPRARRSEIAGERQGTLLVRVTAPPVEGRANREACKLLAAHLGIAPGRVTVARGASARNKLIRVEGLESGALRRELGL
jgi:uncharacterized protein (TIGR00251 family)